MHATFTDVNTYPQSDALVYFENGHTLSPSQFGQLKQIDFNRKSIISMLAEVNKILIAEWQPVNFTKKLVNKELYYALKGIRIKKEAYSGYYRSENHIITHISVSVGRLLDLGVYSFKLLRHYQIAGKDWIVLIQKWSSDFTALRDSVLVLSRVPEPSAADIFDLFSNSRNSTVMWNFELNNEFQSLTKTSAPNNLTESYDYIIQVLANPNYTWRNCQNIGYVKPTFCTSCKAAYDPQKFSKLNMKPVPCKNKICQLAHFDCSGSNLKAELTKSPNSADLLVSFAYFAAGSPVRKVTLNPAPIGIGMDETY